MSRKDDFAFEPNGAELGFPEHTSPHGWLSQDIPCQALWRYYLTMMRNLEEMKKPQLEGDHNPVLNHRQVALGIGRMYGMASPEPMRNYWSNVDLQCTALGMRKLDQQYRF